uniref:Beta-defensin-like domain-containing protein n=1 Tax=Podarcis muralis TaxID=64176 RepID=A0A670HLC1_PODMU
CDRLWGCGAHLALLAEGASVQINYRFSRCRRKGGHCHFLKCPSGTWSFGSCNIIHRCCKRIWE